MPASTMCDFWDDPDVTISGVSDADANDIVIRHNYNRGNVSPSATNMLKMVSFRLRDIYIICTTDTNTLPMVLVHC